MTAGTAKNSASHRNEGAVTNHSARPRLTKPTLSLIGSILSFIGVNYSKFSIT